MALASLNVYISHPLRRHFTFAPWATSHDFGSSDSIGSLKGQSEMTLSRMSSDPNNTV